MYQDPPSTWRSWENRLPKTLVTYIYTSLLCLGIAITNWVLDWGVPFWASMVVSFSIGLSINSMFVFLQKPCEAYFSPYIAAIPLTGVGLAIGLLLAGTFVASDPLFFFADNYATLALGVFFGILGFILFSTRSRLLEMRAQLALAEIEQEKQARLILQTELKLLQAQIEPHFLFNTLSNIAGLIHSQPDIAEETLLNLTTLLRSSLSRTRQTETTLKEELDIARAYLEIHKTRMQGRLSFAIDTPIQDLENVPVPPLLVQPLVENAIKHGIDPKEEGGSIRIVVDADDRQLFITVRDDGIGIDLSSPSSGTGLANVRHRLSTLYGTSASLSLREGADGGVEALLQIPRSA